jgi:hypothetical protein
VRYQHIPHEVFAALPIPGAPVLADMFELIRSHLPPKQKDLASCRQLYPGIRDFSTWAHGHRDALLAAMGALTQSRSKVKNTSAAASAPDEASIDIR